MIKFHFPTYEEWKDNNYNWYYTVGDYNCSIKATTYYFKDKITNYQIAISTNDYPTNMYSNKVFNRYLLKENNEKKLKTWFEKVTLEANEFFCNYIKAKYFGGDVMTNEL